MRLVFRDFPSSMFSSCVLHVGCSPHWRHGPLLLQDRAVTMQSDTTDGSFVEWPHHSRASRRRIDGSPARKTRDARCSAVSPSGRSRLFAWALRTQSGTSKSSTVTTGSCRVFTDLKKVAQRLQRADCSTWLQGSHKSSKIKSQRCQGKECGHAMW